MKLLRKLLIRIILLVMVVSLVIGGLSIYKTYTTTDDLMMAKVNDQLNLRTALIQEKLNSTVRMIEMYAHNPRVQDALKNNATDHMVVDEFSKVLENNSEIMDLISLVDEKGTVLLSDDQHELAGLDLSDRAYLQKASQGKATVISDIIISKADGAVSIAVAKPVYINKVYVGSIVSALKFSIVTDLIKDTKIAEKGYAYIVDINEEPGKVVYHPDAKVEGSNLYDHKIPELDALLDAMQTTESGENNYTFDGEKKYAKYKVFENWALVITANESDLNKAPNEIRNITIITMLLAILLASIAGYLVVKRLIMKPISLLEASMEKAGQGDLTHPVEIHSKDEIEHLAESYNQMLENQQDILKKVAVIAGDLSASAEELTASAEEVNGSATEVSANINNMMENIMTENNQINSIQDDMTHLNTSIDGSDELVGQAQHACETTLVVAQEGRGGVESSVSSISDIAKATSEVIETFSQLNVHAKQVTGISETIRGIAEQINLLALNASIEAARAGEAGRGFTVVAEEVRKLAEQTSEESENIYNVLNTISSLIEKADANVNNSKQHVDDGEATIQSLDGKFLEIISAFESMNSVVNQLQDISRQQVGIADGIKGSIDHVSDTTTHNTSSAQEISAAAEEQAAVTESLSQASEETSAMAEQLNELLSRFKI